MNSTLLYGAGPIDDVSREDALSWRTKLRELLPDRVVCYNPATAFDLVIPDPETEAGVYRKVCAAVHRANDVVIMSSDVLLAYLDGPGLGLGTVREIELAVRSGVRVVVVRSEGFRSFYAHDFETYPTLEDAAMAVATGHVLPRNSPFTYRGLY